MSHQKFHLTSKVDDLINGNILQSMDQILYGCIESLQT